MKYKILCVSISILVTFVATVSFASPKKAQPLLRPAIHHDIYSARLHPEATTARPGIETLKENPSIPWIIGNQANVLKSVKIATASASVPRAVMQDFDHEFLPVVEGIPVVHDFLVHNKGDAPLIIEKVKTD